MKDLVLTKCFSRDDLCAINTIAHAMYEAKYSDSVKPDDKKGKEIFTRLLFADCAHALYILRKSEEYNRKRNELKEICNGHHNGNGLDLSQIYEAWCLKEALDNPESDMDEIIIRGGMKFNGFMAAELIADFMKD